MSQRNLGPFGPRRPGFVKRIAGPLRRLATTLLVAALLAAAIATLASAAAAHDLAGAGPQARTPDERMAKLCTSTAMAARLACQHDVEDDYWTTVVSCNDLDDSDARSACLAEAEAVRARSRIVCAMRFEVRYELCVASDGAHCR